MSFTTRKVLSAASIGALLLPGFAFGAFNSSTVLDFTVDLDAYSDGPWNDVSTNVAISALTDIDVLRGNDDGTFRPDRSLNRAEFMTIVMRLANDNASVNFRCFPDVSAGAWYAEAVCKAKAAGIVRGNAVAGMDASLWRFEPTRAVQYEEAVKVLTKLFAIPVNGDEDGMDWYVPFLQEARQEGLSLSGKSAGEVLTRGEMARLTVAYVAFGTGQLDELRSAERGEGSSSSSGVRSSRSSVSSSSASSMSSSSTSSVGSGVFDQLSDVVVRDNIVVLGTTSPILAGVEFFSNNEPITADAIEIDFTTDADSVAAVLVYGQDSQLITTAYEGSTQGTFRGNIPAGYLDLPQREEVNIYVRAIAKSRQNGGDSGEPVKIEDITIEGTGDWTNNSYNETTSDTFNTFVTAHGSLDAIASIGQQNGVLINGSAQLLGTFELDGTSPDSLYDTRVTSLVFTLNATGNVGLTNVYLTTDDGGGAQSNCSVSGNVITCSSIPSSIGTVDGSRVVRVYADVFSASVNDSLQLTINSPGSPSSAGDITWTDGETTFTWVPLDQPVVQGPIFD